MTALVTDLRKDFESKENALSQMRSKMNSIESNMSRFVTYQPVYFRAVLKNTVSGVDNTVVTLPFETVEGQSLVDGIFRSPKDGIYLLAATINRDSGTTGSFRLYGNGINLCQPYTKFDATRVGSHETTPSCSVIVRLRVGEEAYVTLPNGSNASSYNAYGSRTPFTTFTGAMIKASVAKLRNSFK